MSDHRTSSDNLLNFVLRLATQGRIPEALSILENDVATELINANEFQLGQVAHLFDRAGLSVFADRLFRHLLSRMPRDQSLIHRYALSAWKQGDLEAVRSRGGLLHQSQHDNESTIALVANAAAKSGDLPRALESLERGLEHNPRSHELLWLAMRLAFFDEGDYALAAQLGRAHGHVDFGKMLIYGALSVYQTETPADAMQLLEPLLGINPPDIEGLVCAFEIRRRAGEYESALESINNIFATNGLTMLNESWAHAGFTFESLVCNECVSSHDNKLISVVMTVHKWRPAIRIAVGSILSQTHRNLELIIVIDGASKQDERKIRAFSDMDTRVRIVSLPRNCGTYFAKNQGIARTTGDFITFMDSDDWCHPQRLERALAILDSSPRLQATCDDEIRISSDGSICYGSAWPVRTKATSLFIERRSLLDSVGLFDAVKASADSEMLDRVRTVFGSSGVMCTRMPTILALDHSDSLTGGGAFKIGCHGLSGVRLQYNQNYRTWHRVASTLGFDLRINGRLECRPFPVPPTMLVDPTKTPKNNDLEDRIKRTLPCLWEATRALDVVIEYPVSPSALVTPGLQQSVTVCLFSESGRYEPDRQSLTSLLRQTCPLDTLMLSAGSDAQTPQLPQDSRVIIENVDALKTPGENIFDLVEKAPAGYVFILSDNMIYPRAFLEHMIRSIEHYNREALVGVEAVVLPGPRDRRHIENQTQVFRVLYYWEDYPKDQVVNLIGLRTLCFHTDIGSLERDRTNYCGPADFQIAIEAQRKDWPMVAVGRGPNWLRPASDGSRPLLFVDLVNNTKQREYVMNLLSTVDNWALVPLTARWK